MLGPTTPRLRALDHIQSLSPLQPLQRAARGAKRVLRLPQSDKSRGAHSSGLSNVSSASVPMLCIPSANLELLATLQQAMHASLAAELPLVAWERADLAAKKSAATSTVVVAALGVRWARPCRVLFNTLTATVSELPTSVPVELVLVDHEASAGFDLENVPVGVPATVVFVRGSPVQFVRPAPAQRKSGTAKGGKDDDATTTAAGETRQEGGGDEETGRVEGEAATVTRKCMVGALSVAQAEYLLERCAAAAARLTSAAPSAYAADIVLDLFDDANSPFAQEHLGWRR